MEKKHGLKILKQIKQMPISVANYFKIKRPLCQNNDITNLFRVTRIEIQSIAQKILLPFP